MVGGLVGARNHGIGVTYHGLWWWPAEDIKLRLHSMRIHVRGLTHRVGPCGASSLADLRASPPWCSGCRRQQASRGMMVLGSRDSTSSYFLTINHVCVYVCRVCWRTAHTDRVAGKVIQLDVFTKLFFKSRNV